MFAAGNFSYNLAAWDWSATLAILSTHLFFSSIVHRHGTRLNHVSGRTTHRNTADAILIQPIPTPQPNPVSGTFYYKAYLLMSQLYHAINQGKRGSRYRGYTSQSLLHNAHFTLPHLEMCTERRILYHQCHHITIRTTRMCAYAKTSQFENLHPSHHMKRVEDCPCYFLERKLGV